MSGHGFHVHGPHDHEVEHVAQHGGDNFTSRLAVLTAILSTVGAIFGYMGGHSQNAALLYKNEAAIQKTLRKARQGRTTLIVAHRLSTVADADQILVLKAGRVIERGAHHELVARVGGEYAALWRKQTRAGELQRRRHVEVPFDPALRAVARPGAEISVVM